MEKSEPIQYKDLDRGRFGDYTYQFVDTQVTTVTLMKKDTGVTHDDPLLDLEFDLDGPDEKPFVTTFNRVLTDREKEVVKRLMGNNIGDLDRVKAEVFKYKQSLK